jgi:serine O-acetyltransferase
MHPSISPPRFGTVRWVAEVLQHLAYTAGRRWSPLGFLFKQLNHFLTGADIGWQADIGPGLALPHPTGLVVGREVVIGSDCVLQSCVTLGGLRSNERGQPALGDRVLVGTGARVLGEVSIGNDVTIGANSVVMSDVPDGATVVGVPARIISRDGGVK